MKTIFANVIQVFSKQTNKILYYFYAFIGITRILIIVFEKNLKLIEKL